MKIVGLASGLTQPLEIFLVIEKLGQDKPFLQWLVMTNGAAMLAGGIAIMGIAKKVKPQSMLMLGLLVTAVCTMGIGASTMIWLTMVLYCTEHRRGLYGPGIRCDYAFIYGDASHQRNEMMNTWAYPAKGDTVFTEVGDRLPQRNTTCEAVSLVNRIISPQHYGKSLKLR
ncbi:hypothetical protein J6TS7_60930 [Paenibacillus dendritiformis]|nr:hypothetical protein J6TS7_60930 [Paenibacillus dendritiformis]